MVNVPAQPLEKLWIRAKQAEEFGKHFDENLERRVLGLPPVNNREPILIQERRERAELTLTEDRQGLEELQAEVASDQSNSIGDRIAELERLLAETQRQNEELRGLVGGTKAPTPATPAAHTGSGPAAPDKPAFPAGKPNTTWSKTNLRNFMSHYQIPEPPGGFNSKTNMQLLEYLLAEAETMKLFEAAT